MNFFEMITGEKAKSLSKDDIAALLKTTPEALEKFEKAYKLSILEEEDDNFFHVNAKQAVAQAAESSFGDEFPKDLCNRIVWELIARTEVFKSDYTGAYAERYYLPESTAPVTREEICRLPVEQRPQLSGQLMKLDVAENSSEAVLLMYQKAMTEKNPKAAKKAYHMFRQGLDILDLNALMYAIIDNNANSIGHWFPQLLEANKNHDFFQIPKTTIAKVPITLLQLTRILYADLTPATRYIVDEWAKKIFSLDEAKDYFVKTGTYSSKFDFRNAHVHGAGEVRELGEYLLFIHHQALQMAGPLSEPSIYGVSTTTEWAVREFIPDKENNPCIYHGLPLHTEYRVFIDCDTNSVLAIVPYWEPNTMKNRFSHGPDAQSPHQMHDYVIYKAHEDILMQRYYENRDRVVQHVQELLPDLDLTGQWSLDIMQNGDDFWLIDMALAENSAFYDCVPKELRRVTPEKWLPEIQ